MEKKKGKAEVPGVDTSLTSSFFQVKLVPE